ncbi:MAG: hypothetical protein WD638_09500 [Nitriliruptoraceae bacterium]
MSVLGPRRYRPRSALVSAGLLALLLLPARPAGAHPFVEGGGELPVDSLVEITLKIAHGCGDEGDGEGAETREVALEVPEWLRVVEVLDHDGYAPDVEVSDGRTSVVTWRDAGGAQPAPAFDLTVVADGDVGESRYLRVFQGCDDASYRWIGTPDEPADDPAIEVELTAADPDRPAPPPEPEEPEADTETDPEGDEEPVEEPSVEDPSDDRPDEETPPTVDARDEPEEVTDEGEDGGLPRWLLPGLAAVAVIGLGVVGARRR